MRIRQAEITEDYWIKRCRWKMLRSNNHYKKKLGISCFPQDDMTDNDLLDLLREFQEGGCKCVRCGQYINLLIECGSYQQPTLDRLDSKISYRRGNVAIAHEICNTIERIKRKEGWSTEDYRKYFEENKDKVKKNKIDEVEENVMNSIISVKDIESVLVEIRTRQSALQAAPNFYGVDLSQLEKRVERMKKQREIMDKKTEDINNEVKSIMITFGIKQSSSIPARRARRDRSATQIDTRGGIPTKTSLARQFIDSLQPGQEVTFQQICEKTNLSHKEIYKLVQYPERKLAKVKNKTGTWVKTQ